MGAPHPGIRRRLVTAPLLAVALVAVALAGVAPPAANATPRPADVVTTVDFEAYSPGTVITNQYSGISFETPPGGFTLGTPPADGVVSVDVGGPPVVAAQGAHSGTNAGELMAPSEFGTFGTFAALGRLADSVSVYIGDLNGVSVHVELDAYDADRHLLSGSDTALTSGTGANTLLHYSTGGAADIAYVALYSTDHIGTDGVIDDLAVSVPPSSSPIVGVSTIASTYEIGQGGSRDIPVSVVRLDGASGPVTVGVSGLPTGVTSSFSEDPVSSTDTATALTLDVADNVPSGNYPISLSASATGATSQAPAVITLSIAPAVVVSPPSTAVQVGACGHRSVSLAADVGPGLTGPLTFTVDASTLAAGLSASFNPAQADVVSGGATTELDLSSTGGGGTSAIRVTAALPDGASATFNVPVQQTGPQITSISMFGGSVASTPRGQHPGTTVEIYGNNFCNSATVAFGNDHATVVAAVKQNNLYDYIRVTTPRDATSGPVTVTAGSPAVSGTSPQSLTVDSFRNEEAFNFHNFETGFSIDDLTNAFGSQQTYINVNVCGFLTLGLANCSVSTGIPDPVAAAWLGIADAALQGGTCFGISLTDQRLLAGELDVKSFPRSADNVYGLNGPATSGSNSWAGGSEPLLEVLKAQHLQQFSTEFLSTWLSHASAQSVETGSQVVSAVASEIEKVFAAGRYPLIELNDGNGGGGHVVVAYDITPDTDGGYDIYVYDSNNPYTSNEDTDGAAHAAAVAASVIDLESNGTWQLASTTEPASSGGGPFQGGPSAIVVTDPAALPLHPTLATLGGIAPGLLFSSAGAPGSAGGGVRGAGRVTQLTGPGGKTLYNANGTLDTNRATRLDAAPFAPLVAAGESASARPQLFVVGQDVHQLSVSTAGTRRGSSTETFVDGGFAGSVSSSALTGAHQQVTFAAASGTVGFTGTTPAPLSLAVNQASATGSRTVQVSSVGALGGTVNLTLDPGNGAVTVSHRGGAAAITITLSGQLRGGLPTSFTSGPVSVGPDQAVTLSKVSWGGLATDRLSVRVGDRTLVLRNQLKLARLATITTLHAMPAAHHTVRLVVDGRFGRLLAPGSTAFVVWLVHRGKRVIAQHSAALLLKDKGFSSSWTVHLGKATGLSFSAEVVAVAVRGTAEASSVATSSLELSTTSAAAARRHG